MVSLTPERARAIWLRAQRLDSAAPFGSGPAAAQAAIAHLGYVQIDTINVIERSHHHILFSRIPDYRRADLKALQSTDKAVFEYWTHALSYVATDDLPFFLAHMAAHKRAPGRWFEGIERKAVTALLRQIREEGPLTIRDIDDAPVEKTHLWASRKPSKRVLELAFYNGELAIAARDGMVKTYELFDRHFDPQMVAKAASPAAVRAYRLARSLRAQGLISAASVMHPRLSFSAEMTALVAREERAGRLIPVSVAGSDERYWARPETLETPVEIAPDLVHLLSPFDPLVIQRRRLAAFFGYEHVFEAYVPQHKRRFGYFTLPVLVGDRVAAALDLKADRAEKRLRIQAWHDLDPKRARADKRLIEAALDRFARFQFGD